MYKIAHIAVVIILLFLSGCTSPAEFTTDPVSQSESPSEAAVLFPDYVYDPDAARYYSGNYAVSNEDGYYLVINRVLHFFDIRQDTLFPLCTKASCLHRDQTCDGYVYDFSKSARNDLYVNGWSANARDGRIYYNQDHLYTVGVHPDKGIVLFRYNKDYHEQEEIVWLEDYRNAPFIRCIQDSLLFHSGYVYYVTWLYQEDKAAGLEYETEFTAWRYRLDQKTEPEKLFVFEFGKTAAQRSVRTCAFNGGIYYFIEHESQYIIPDAELKEGDLPYQVTAASARIYRYDEKNEQEELIWSYAGDQTVGLFEAEGAIPSNRTFSTPMYSGDSVVNAEGDYAYLAGYPERYEQGLMPTSISMVNLESREGKVLYQTPYMWIEQLRTDGKYYYFKECGKKHIYVTAIDREGNLIRRYEMPLDEAFIESERKREQSLREMLAQANTEEERAGIQEALERLLTEEGDPGSLRLLVTDGRYITLGSYGGSPVYKNLSSRVPCFSQSRLSFEVDDGIGLIDTEAFISGKDVEIRQIYERMEGYGD